MAGHIDLGDNLDAEALAEGHDLADCCFAVVAAGRLRAAAQQRRQRLAVTAPGTNRGQRRVGVDLNAPGLILAEVGKLTPEVEADADEAILLFGAMEQEVKRCRAIISSQTLNATRGVFQATMGTGSDGQASDT